MAKNAEKLYEWSGMELAILVLFTLVGLAITVDVNDSTILKPYLMYAGSVGVVCLAGWMILSARMNSLRLTTGHLLFGIYILVCGFSLAVAYNRQMGLESLAFRACCGVVFAASYQAFQQERARERALRWIMIFTLGVTAFGYVQGLLPSIFSYAALSSGRPFISTFGNSNYFAGYLILVLPVIGAMALTSASSGWRAAAAVTAVSTIGMLLLTGARSSWVAAIISLSLFAYLALRSRQRWYLLGAIAALAVIGTLAFPEIIQQRAAHLFERSGDSTLTRRLFFFEAAWRSFLASPLLGNGIGNFLVVLPRFRSPDYWMYKSEDIVTHAHNEYLEILSETGIIGLAAFIALIGWMVYSIVKGLRGTSGTKRIVLAGYLAGIVAVLIDNLGSFNLRTYPVAVAFWMLAAFALHDAGAGDLMIWNISTPTALRWVRWAPAGLFAVFLAWFIPMVYDRVETDRLFFQGFYHDVTHRDAEAAQEFEEGLRHSPADIPSHFYYAASLMKLKRYQEGAEHADIVLRANPWFPKAHLIRAVCRFESGDTTGAWEDLRNELQYSSMPLANYYASYFHYRGRHTDEELNSLTILLNNAIRSGIGDYVVTSLDRFVKINKEKGNVAACDTMTARIRSTFPHDAAIMTEVVECYGMLNELDLARSAFDQAIAIEEKKEETARRLDEIRGHLGGSGAGKEQRMER